MHDPAKVLADIAAKRAILDQYEAAFPRAKAHPEDFASKGALLALHGVVRLLASAYAWHPDYRPEWSPGRLAANPPGPSQPR